MECCLLRGKQLPCVKKDDFQFILTDCSVPLYTAYAMVDVLSWLNTDHGYFGSCDGPDAVSSEPSSPPSGSDEGEECNLPSPKAFACSAHAFGDTPLSFEQDDTFLLSLFSDSGKGGGSAVEAPPTTASLVCADSLWPLSQPPLPGTVFQEMAELVGHTSPFSDNASNSQSRPSLPGKRGPPTVVAQHSPVVMQVQKTAIANGTPTCWGGGTEKKDSDHIFDRNRKNAEAAKQNRLKKKAYLETLEAEAETLREENKRLKSCCSDFEQKASDLAEEVEYLRSVIKNQSSLSALLQNIPSVKSVKLSSPLGKRRSMESGTSAYSSTKRARSSGGVCLHVAKDTVSLEFCPQCSIHAVADQQGEEEE